MNNQYLKNFYYIPLNNLFHNFEQHIYYLYYMLNFQLQHYYAFVSYYHNQYALLKFQQVELYIWKDYFVLFDLHLLFLLFLLYLYMICDIQFFLYNVHDNHILNVILINKYYHFELLQNLLHNDNCYLYKQFFLHLLIYCYYYIYIIL